MLAITERRQRRMAGNDDNRFNIFVSFSSTVIGDM